MSKATNVTLKIQSGTTRTVYATWTWSKTYTDHYEYRWYYATGDGIWFVGEGSGSTTFKQCTYSAPENAIKVKFKVKPIAKTTKVNGKDKKKWTADWSTEKTLNLTEKSVESPPVPTVTLKDLKLIARVDNLDSNCKHVEFQVVKNDDFNITLPKKKIPVDKLSAAMSVSVLPDSEYKVRCRGIRNSIESEWSDYSSPVKTLPNAPEKIVECRALSTTSVYLSWKKSKTADNYEIQYATKQSDFDSSSNVKSLSTDNANVCYREITGLETGNEYFFRVRASNGNGVSGWTNVKSVKIGREPSPPTTWSSKTTIEIGGELYLYWVHNAEDNSNQTKGRIEIDDGTGSAKKYDVYKAKATSYSFDDVSNTKYFNLTYADEDFVFTEGFSLIVDFPGLKKSSSKGILVLKGVNYDVKPDGYSWDDGTRVTFVYKDNVFYAISKTEAPVDDENDSTFVYSVDTTQYSDGTKLKWRVATQGILNNWSEWSVQRTVDLYSSPTVEIQCDEELTTYPYRIKVTVGPNTQKPIGYHLSIVAVSSYETVNEIGQSTYITSGTEVFSKYFDTSNNPLLVDLSPGNIMLENNAKYNVTCTISTTAGLTAENTVSFTVSLEDSDMNVDAEIGVDPDQLFAIIRPYCADNYGEEIDNDALFSIYRREYDGTFTPIAIDVTKDVYQLDVHPALDYARYRVIARSQSTGSLEYYDVPGYPIGEKSAVIQWDDTYYPFDTTEESEMEDSAVTSMMVKLPYNLDVSESNKIDVSHVNYIGRKHPVAYYGTHVGETQAWNVAIVKDDIETLHLLRRLQKWMGNVYIREPSGSGYWATVEVSFSQKHKAKTIPVNINITRVEGGV